MREFDDYVYNPDLDDWEALLVGRRIVATEIKGFEEESCAIVTLDNGKRFRVKGNDGCGGCSSGWYWVTHLQGVDNIITSVSLETEPVSTGTMGWGEEAWIYRVFVITNGLSTEFLRVEGDDGNGYYGTGYYLELLED